MSDLRQQLQALARYLPVDIERRPSCDEYISANELDALQRQEERRRVLSPGVISPARQWEGSNRLADVRGVGQHSTISRAAQFRRKRLAQGLCYCGAAVVVGRTMCVPCLEKNRQKAARYRKEFVSRFTLLAPATPAQEK